MRSVFVVCLLAGLAAASAWSADDQAVSLKIDWNKVTRESQTTPTLQPTKAEIGSRPERAHGHTGTETRARLLREAAVGNLAQWGQPDRKSTRLNSSHLGISY